MMFRRLVLTALLAASFSTPALSQPRSITLASTTSTEQSGLFGHILPLFTNATGIEVRVVALGTGQALDVGRRGDADVLLVHDRAAEDRFVSEGFATQRFDVMYNDFVLVGPGSDPARVKGTRDALAALRAIASVSAPFVSRGDRSGTHAAELRWWKDAGVDLATARGPWYREIGGGMGQALNVASGLDAYTISDRGTWLSFSNRGSLAVAVEGDARMFNPYGAMLVNPARHPHVKVVEGQAFLDWLVGKDGQAAIASYRIGGEQLFFPSATTTTRQAS